MGAGSFSKEDGGSLVCGGPFSAAEEGGGVCVWSDAGNKVFNNSNKPKGDTGKNLLIY